MISPNMPLPRELEEFFIGLPSEHDPRGICQTSEEAQDGGIAVEIATECTADACKWLECVMFQAVVNPADGEIQARIFKPHRPAYKTKHAFTKKPRT